MNSTQIFGKLLTSFITNHLGGVRIAMTQSIGNTI